MPLRGARARPTTGPKPEYANNFYPAQIEIYAVGEPGSPLIGTIANGISSGYNLGVDASGTLYVQNNNLTISEYAPGALTPKKILTEAANQGTFAGIAVGPDSARCTHRTR